MSGIWTTCFIPPPEKSQKVKALTGSVIMDYWLDKEENERLLLFTLDMGESWRGKRKDITDSFERWKRKHEHKRTGTVIEGIQGCKRHSP